MLKVLVNVKVHLAESAEIGTGQLSPVDICLCEGYVQSMIGTQEFGIKACGLITGV